MQVSNNISHAAHEWKSRRSDESFPNLPAMADHFQKIQDQSRELVMSTRKITAAPVGEDHKGLAIVGPAGTGYTPTHWAFGQLAALAEAPASYLRRLPSEMASDCINWGLTKLRNVEDIGLLLQRDPASWSNSNGSLNAATGPRYGRIWNGPVVNSLIRNFGDGLTGDWRVPRAYDNRNDTTLYAGDRDMFVFLADETNKVEIPNRRNGKSGLLSRGFWISNSEVGSAVFMMGLFFFDNLCANRTLFGASDYQEIRIRHTASAPDRWLEELQPALLSYANSSTVSLTDAIGKAQASRLEPDKVDEFLASRFGARMAAPLTLTHLAEEGRPIENLWDVSVAATAHAKSIPNQDVRVDLERKAGAVLKLAA